MLCISSHLRIKKEKSPVKVLIDAYNSTEDCRETQDTIGLVLCTITLTLRYFITISITINVNITVTITVNITITITVITITMFRVQYGVVTLATVIYFCCKKK